MRVLVAMSGGVDSSVAAAMVLEQGHEVIGVTLKQWTGPDGRLPTAGCCTVVDAEDARSVAARLGVAHYVLDYTEAFRTEVVEPFSREYLAGRTPNPCVTCNRSVRFGALAERAAALGCDALATGHHARVRHDAAGWHLLKGADPAKDQSYVLHGLGQEDLATIRFPDWSSLQERGAGAGRRTRYAGGNQGRQPGPVLHRAWGPPGVPGRALPRGRSRRSDRRSGTRRGWQPCGCGRFYHRPAAWSGRRPRRTPVRRGGATDDEHGRHRPQRGSVGSGLHRSGRVVRLRITACWRAHRGEGSLSVGAGSVQPFASMSVSGRSISMSPQEAVAPGQSAVFYDGDEVIGGGTIDEAMPARGAPPSRTIRPEVVAVIRGRP